MCRDTSLFFIQQVSKKCKETAKCLATHPSTLHTYSGMAKIRTTELISHEEYVWTMMILNSVPPILHFSLRENRVWSSRNFRRKYREVSPLSSGEPQHALNLQMTRKSIISAIMLITCTLQLNDVMCRIIIE